MDIAQSSDTKTRIASRESWFRIAIITIFAVVFGWKLIGSPFTFDFSKFDFSDLLSLLLAFFSISLAVAFYFKATETSNRFYDNTFKFTKEISEILGRIEAGFGERLRHLDEGYSGLRDRFSSPPTSTQVGNIENAKKEIEQEKMKLEQEVKERKSILESMLNKAKLHDTEKADFLKKLEEKDKDILNLNRELHLLRRHVRTTEPDEAELDAQIPTRLNALLRDIVATQLDRSMLLEAPIDFIKRRVRIDREPLSPRAIEDMISFGVVDPNFGLTNRGAFLLKKLARRQ